MSQAEINQSHFNKVLPSQTQSFHVAAGGKLEGHTWISDTGPLSEHSHKCLLGMATPPLDKLSIGGKKYMLTLTLTTTYLLTQTYILVNKYQFIFIPQCHSLRM